MSMHARRVGLVAVILAGAALLQGRQAAGQPTKDPILGTWVLNRDKSTFSANFLEARTIRFEAVKGGELREVDFTRRADASFNEVAYVAREDGKDYPISNANVDRVSLRRIDSRTIERMGKLRGRLVETRTMVVSPDGNTLTVTTKAGDATQPQSVQVFDRMAQLGLPAGRQ